MASEEASANIIQEEVKQESVDAMAAAKAAKVAAHEAEPQPEEHERREKRSSKHHRKSTKKAGGKSSSGKKKKKKARSIGRWYIGETLGKGGYSWVKKGYDKRTSKCVALKFMAKADQSWAEEQTKQVVAEIESLKKIRHPNVMKLYAYNLNAKYPTKTREKIESILLVLEFAPGGELFDILYYTSALETVVARTYFRQFMAGLQACHDAGVAHRDLKPQNLLLDAKFNLKIADFGLSKVFATGDDTLMKTTYVGTRGYQSPELLLNREYDLACDVFSAGVVLFILLTGYPPFEQAHKSDRWFRPLAKRNYQKFWGLHAECNIADDADAKHLLQSMMAYNPRDRLTLEEVREHPWFNSTSLHPDELIKKLVSRHRKMEKKRRQDARKMADLNTSYQPPQSVNRGMQELEGVGGSVQPPSYPGDELNNVYCTYTTAPWKDVVNKVHITVGSNAGKTFWDMSTFTLRCVVKLCKSESESANVRFEVQLFRSREFQRADESESEDEDEDQEQNQEEKEEKEQRTRLNVVRMRRLEGDVLDWKNVQRKLLYDTCADVFTGMPAWARRMLRDRERTRVVDEEDDYDKILSGEGTGFQIEVDCDSSD